MTVRKQLTIWYAVLLIIIIVLFGTITFAVMRFTMISNIDQTLRDTASLIASESTQLPIVTFGETQVELHLAKLDRFRASGIHVQAWNLQDGQPQLWGHSPSLEALDMPLNPNGLGDTNPKGRFSSVMVSGVDLRVLTVPIFSGDQMVGNMQVAADMAGVNDATELLLIVMLVSCGVAIPGAGILSMWFSNRALQPIEKINRAAASIVGANDLGTRLDWQGANDELGRLAAVFNQMMDRIEHLFQVQQRFVADVSHELRTPLTAIQGNLELANRYGMDDVSLEAINSETRRMSRLVNDLLMLARTDSGDISLTLTPLDLDTVVLDTYQQSKRLMKDTGLTLELHPFEPIRINGDADRVKQVLINLLNNSMKFTESGGKVTIGLQKINHHAVLTVEDTGQGIPPNELDRVFDRFYQADPSRAHQGGGFGLGLSIAKWVVEAHDGMISVSSRANEGTMFTITIPEYDPLLLEPVSPHRQPTRPRLPIIRLNRS